MLFVPKRWKYKKHQKGKRINKIIGLIPTLTSRLHFGKIGLRSKEAGILNSKQLLTIRQTINKGIKRQGKLKINIFPQKPISNKPSEVRMGKGKGSISHWHARFKKGTILLEIETPKLNIAKKTLEALKNKLSIETQIINQF